MVIPRNVKISKSPRLVNQLYLYDKLQVELKAYLNFSIRELLVNFYNRKYLMALIRIKRISFIREVESAYENSTKQQIRCNKINVSL